MVWGLNPGALTIMEASTKVGSGDSKGKGPKAEVKPPLTRGDFPYKTV